MLSTPKLYLIENPNQAHPANPFYRPVYDPMTPYLAPAVSPVARADDDDRGISGREKTQPAIRAPHRGRDGRFRGHLQTGASPGASDQTDRRSHAFELASAREAGRILGFGATVGPRTSGLLLAAKTSGSASELGGLIEKRQVEKEYMAIVQGRVEPAEGVIDAPLGRIG